MVSITSFDSDEFLWEDLKFSIRVSQWYTTKQYKIKKSSATWYMYIVLSWLGLNLGQSLDM